VLISQSQHPIRAIELTPGIYVQTGLPQAYIPALRSGFAQYPANPRWSALKFQAWKTGRQLRQAHDRGAATIGSGDRTFILTDGSQRSAHPASERVSEISKSGRSWVHSPC